jgi:hypothetical protein
MKDKEKHECTRSWSYNTLDIFEKNKKPLYNPIVHNCFKAKIKFKHILLRTSHEPYRILIYRVHLCAIESMHILYFSHSLQMHLFVFFTVQEFLWHK